MRKLQKSFYVRDEVIQVAKDLLGKILITNFNGELTSGRIVETEAYAGVTDKASHAWNNKRTSRTGVMYAPGGIAYVYLCYGIHHLFNVVTNKVDVPHAVLIRGVEPLQGVEMMLKRTKKKKADYTLTKGPGNVSKALGIFTKHSGMSLLEDKIFIAADGYKQDNRQIIATPRIGVAYAGEDALLPYRFIVKDSPYVSGRKE